MKIGRQTPLSIKTQNRSLHMPRVLQNFSEFFFVHYLGTGKPFSMSGRAQKPIGPKTSPKMVQVDALDILCDTL